jgi:hypothetical protein
MKEYPVKGGEFFGESFGDLIITLSHGVSVLYYSQSCS